MSAPVYVNGRFLTQVQSGMQRYARCLLEAWDLVRLEQGGSERSEVTVLVPQGQHGDLPQLETITIKSLGRLKGHAWEQTELLWASRDGVLVSLISAGPVLHRNHVVAMHDAAIFAKPEHFSRGYRTMHRLLRPRLAKGARQLITISEFSRRELARYCRVPPERFEIIPDSAEHILQVGRDPGVLERSGLTAKKYFLCVGNQSPNKNLIAAARGLIAANLDDYELAVVGGGASKIFGTDSSLSGYGIKPLGRVDDAGLRSLYENSAALIFPSRYEGFGVPPLEAMTLGCPVISSNTSAMPEVLGDAAILLAPDDYSAIGSAMNAIATNAELSNSLAQAGLERARLYSWKSGAQRLDNLVGACLSTFR